MKKHKEKKTFKCDKCDFECNSAKGLNGHAKTHGQKTLKCYKCDFTTVTSKKLKTHMKTHTGEENPVKTLFGRMFEINMSAAENTPLISSNAKRGLSVSPEVVDNKKLQNKKKKSTI